MKSLNKKGFTLVELLAAIVILAVLMLAGASAVGGIMRSSRANSLKSSLDAAVKQAQTSYAQDELKEVRFVDGEIEGDFDNLKSVLDYEDTQYRVDAAYYSIDGKEYIVAAVTADDDGSFKAVRCNHGKMNKESKGSIYDAEGDVSLSAITTDAYYCVDGTNHEDPAMFIRIKRIAN